MAIIDQFENTSEAMESEKGEWKAHFEGLWKKLGKHVSFCIAFGITHKTFLYSSFFSCNLISRTLNAC